jgi:hypothetical protein
MNTNEFIGMLFEIRDAAHIAHLQTSSYAEHMALNGLYDDIVGLADRYAESYQGKYGILKDIPVKKVLESGDMITYLKSKATQIESFKSTVKEGYLLQIIDDVHELLYSTIYKLRFLK